MGRYFSDAALEEWAFELLLQYDWMIIETDVAHE